MTHRKSLPSTQTTDEFVHREDGTYYDANEGQFEQFKRNKEIPQLAKIWSKRNPKKQIKSYLNTQKIKMVLEIEPSNCQAPIQEGGQLVAEIMTVNPE
jgi:hypothetical protein